MRIRTINFLYLILGFFGFKSSPAAAEIFLCAPEIPGDVTFARYVDCIDAQSWQWGAGLAISRQNGSVSFSNPSLSEATMTKQSDSSSKDLMNYMVNKQVIPKLDLFIDPCGSCADGAPSVKVAMSDVYISGISVSTGGDIPSESASFNYGTIQWCFLTDTVKQTLECTDIIPVVPAP